MKRSPRPVHDVLELCAATGERLKAAGFEVASVSMRSEAVYYRLPGREGLLRVATHSSRHPPIGLGDVLASITFRGREVVEGRFVLRGTPEGIENTIYRAVGQYMMRSASPRPKRNPYLGKRGTWESPSVAGGDP